MVKSVPSGITGGSGRLCFRWSLVPRKNKGGSRRPLSAVPGSDSFVPCRRRRRTPNRCRRRLTGRRSESRRSHLPFQPVKGANNTGGGVIFDLDDNFLSGIAFRQDQKGRLRSLLTQDGIHFPVTDGRPGVHFLRTLFDTGSGGSLAAFLWVWVQPRLFLP